MYGDMLESDLKELKKLAQAGDFDGMYEAAAGFTWKRLSSKKDETVSPEKKGKGEETARPGESAA